MQLIPCIAEVVDAYRFKVRCGRLSFVNVITYVIMLFVTTHSLLDRAVIPLLD